MKFDNDSCYNLVKIYENKDDDVIAKVVALLEDIKKTLRGREYVVKYVESMFDNAMENIKSKGCCYEEISGNQDGTEIEFGYGVVNEEKSNIIISLKQEEYELISKNFSWIEDKIIDITDVPFGGYID
jgi:uncharacterized protein (DUF2225 family)